MAGLLCCGSLMVICCLELVLCVLLGFVWRSDVVALLCIVLRFVFGFLCLLFGCRCLLLMWLDWKVVCCVGL